MAVPIRLNIGNRGQSEIDLIAQSIDMSVDRNVSAFPTPFGGNMKRFAIDTNIPRVQIEIAGIIEDDVIPLAGEETEFVMKGSTVIDFTNALPNDAADIANLPRSSRSGVNASISRCRYSALEDYAENGSNVLRLQRHGVSGGGAGASIRIGSGANMVSETLWESNGAYGAGTTTTIDVKFNGGTRWDWTAIPKIFVKDTIICKSDGSIIGVVDSTDGERTGSVTFTAATAVALADGDELYIKHRLWNSMAQQVGIVEEWDTSSGELTLLAKNAVPIEDGEQLYVGSIPNVEEVLSDPSIFIKLVPAYWAEDVSRSPYGQKLDVDNGISGTNNIQGIRFRFDASKDYSTQVPYLRSYADIDRDIYTGDATGDAGDAVMEIPIKGIFDANNPSEELAKKFVEALEYAHIVVFQTHGPIIFGSPRGGFQPYTTAPSLNRMTDAFSASRYGSRVIVEQVYVPERPIETGNSLSNELQDLFNMRSMSRANSKASSSSYKSAGDKVQDLVGLSANAPADSQGMILGVQIPYDSFVTSDSVSGIARNFFLTFGDIDVNRKGARANERSASLPFVDVKIMDSKDVGGEYEEPTTEFNKYFGVAGELLDNTLHWVKNVGKDLWITLTAEERGNDGGIRITPEKLHVRYDAGNNYYAFNLILVASDFVVGV